MAKTVRFEFPNDVEVIVHPNEQENMIWVKGSFGPADNRKFGTLRIRTSKGPKGLAVEIHSGVGDLPLQVSQPVSSVVIVGEYTRSLGTRVCLLED